MLSELYPPVSHSLFGTDKLLKPSTCLVYLGATKSNSITPGGLTYTPMDSVAVPFVCADNVPELKRGLKKKKARLSMVTIAGKHCEEDERFSLTDRPLLTCSLELDAIYGRC